MGPEIRVKEGEPIRVIIKNFLPQETTIHWHGILLNNAMDGVPGVTQKPMIPGETFVYEFLDRTDERISITAMSHNGSIRACMVP
jgi:FtsP/CotA-like multicopper oxidase with cupredoxin domain